jgi:DNA-binding transcriptional LysR family regulator
MLNIDDLRLFHVLAEQGTLAAAARTLRVTPPALSIRLAKIEARMGVSLVIRGARQVTFTDEGLRLVQEARMLLVQLDGIDSRVVGAAQALSGQLRVLAPFGFGRKWIGPLVQRFAQAHPQIHCALVLAENPLQNAAQADVVVHVGALTDSSWVAHLLARNERWLCASPAYLRTCKRPNDPQDLVMHACLCLRENEEDLTLWRFRRSKSGRARGRAADATGRERTVRIKPNLITNDGDVLCQWAMRGAGIMLRSQWDVMPRVKSGELVRLLPDWTTPAADINALVPKRLGVSARVQAFLQFAKSEFQPVPPWVKERKP